ncbi:MAG: Cas10/Cmr2 second palm domain-containing protein [Anaerolineae bacterium]
MTERVLLAGDVDAIKEFVFETSSLPQIRGGSELLLECEEEIANHLAQKYGYEVIYCGGGSFLIEVPAEKAEGVAQAIEHLYLGRTGVATVTIVREEDTPAAADLPPLNGWAERIRSAVAAGPFSRRVYALGAKMQAAKRQKSHAPFYEALPFVRRCDCCGKRMAAYPDRVEPNKYLCPVCNLRDKEGREKKQQINGQDIRGKFNQKFCSQFKGDSPARQPEDLDALLQATKRKYLALIYADGNDTGRLLQRAKSPGEYRAISQALRESTEKALFEAIARVCGPSLQQQEYWPFDIINVGGDDIIVLIQAGYAWEVAVEFLERFEREVDQQIRNALGGSLSEGLGKITASCGIAIADAKYPIRYLERLATDLLKRAKEVAKADRDDPKSALTFLWLPTPVASEKAEPLLVPYIRHPIGESPMELTARPYELEQARQLLNSVKEIARWPRTLRHRWAEALTQGVLVSVSAIYYDIARRSSEKREAMYQTLVQVGGLAAGSRATAEIPEPIWYQHRDGDETIWRTALLDALELAELQGMRPDVEEEAEG